MAIIIRVAEHELHRYTIVNATALHATIQGMKTARWEYTGRVTCQINGGGRQTYSQLEFIGTPEDAALYLQELKDGKHTARTADEQHNGTGPDVHRKVPRKSRRRAAGART